MITLHWYDETYTGDYAVKGEDYVALYDEEFTETFRIINIHGGEWDHISIEGGDWSDPSAIPSREEKLRADVDYLLMIIEEM